MILASKCKAQLLVEHEMRLAQEWAEQEARQWWEEEEFAKEMADLELKKEEEWKAWEEKECRVWEVEEKWWVQEEEENRLWLASKQEKRWLVELAEQWWQEQMAEERAEGSLKGRGNGQKEEVGDCWGCRVQEEVCQWPGWVVLKQISGMEIGDKVLCMVKFCGRKPREFVVSVFVTKPLDKVE